MAGPSLTQPRSSSSNKSPSIGLERKKEAKGKDSTKMSDWLLQLLRKIQPYPLVKCPHCTMRGFRSRFQPAMKGSVQRIDRMLNSTLLLSVMVETQLLASSRWRETTRSWNHLRRMFRPGSAGTISKPSSLTQVAVSICNLPS